MRKLIFSIVLLLTTTNSLLAQDLSISGPDKLTHNSTVVYEIKGLPKLDLEKPLKDNLAWVDKVNIKFSAPENREVDTHQLLGINFLTKSWELKFAFVPVVKGDYVIIVDNNINNSLLIKRVSTEGTTPTPVPPTPPTPDDPSFDNLLSLVQGLSTKLNQQKRDQLSIVYEDVAKQLENGSIGSINMAAAQIKAQRTAILGDPLPAEWAVFYAEVGKVWDKYWPMGRADVVKFYNIVSKGL